MENKNSSGESLTVVFLSSVRNIGFWSFIAAIVGAVAVVAGGILYIGVEDTRGFSVSTLIIGFSLLFLALVLSPRGVAMFLVGRRGRYGVNALVMTVAFLAAIVLVNLLFFRNPTRFDVTATKVFTLAPQTLQVLDSLESPVRANAFFVPSSPAAQPAEDLLNEFLRRSRDFTYRMVDPEISKSMADQYDVTQFPTIVFEDLELGRRQAIFRFTEQEYVTGILVATGVSQKAVYFLTGHGEAGLTRDPVTDQTDGDGFDFALLGVLRDNYFVRPLELKQTGRVPEDTAVLVIAGPAEDLEDFELAVLEEYVRSGGRIIALFDPTTPDSFVRLISRWGATLARGSIADAASNVAGERLTPLAQRSNGQYLSSANTGVTIADRIDVTFFPNAAPVDMVLPSEDMPPTILFSPLVFTTDASWLESDIDDVSFDPDTDQRGPFFLGAVVRATGTVDESERHPEAKFVIFGDSDFARNKFFYSSDNSDLFLNSINWLAEDFELISIRPKLVPFRELVLNTNERDLIKWVSWFLPPSFMLALGTIVWWRRR